MVEKRDQGDDDTRPDTGRTRFWITIVQASLVVIIDLNHARWNWNRYCCCRFYSTSAITLSLFSKPSHKATDMMKSR